MGMRLGNVDPPPAQPQRPVANEDYDALRLAHTVFVDAVSQLRRKMHEELAVKLGLTVDQVAKLWHESGCT